MATHDDSRGVGLVGCVSETAHWRGDYFKRADNQSMIDGYISSCLSQKAAMLTNTDLSNLGRAEDCPAQGRHSVSRGRGAKNPSLTSSGGGYSAFALPVSGVTRKRPSQDRGRTPKWELTLGYPGHVRKQKLSLLMSRTIHRLVCQKFRLDLAISWPRGTTSCSGWSPPAHR